MNILLDTTLPPRFARALHLLMHPDHSVSHVRDLLGNDATDQHMADHLIEHPDTFVIGIDLEVSEHPHRVGEILAWNRAVFLLHADWMESELWDQAWMLNSRIPDMLKKVSAVNAPAVFLVPADAGGRIRKLA